MSVVLEQGAAHVPRTGAQQRTLNVAYVVSRFPKLTETFILNEVLALLDLGDDVTIYPLNLERSATSQPGVERAFEQVEYVGYCSAEVLRAFGYYMTHTPKRLLAVLATVVRENVGSPRFLVRSLALFPKSLAYARRAEAKGVAHLHAHFATHATTATYIISQLTGIPFSFTAHAHDIYVDRHMLREKANAATTIVTVSEANRRLLCKLLGSSTSCDIVVVRNGIDLSRFIPPTTDRPDSPFQILCVGALEEKKGQRFLLEACRILQRRGVPFVCELIGDGPERAALEQQRRTLPDPEAVRLLGGQPRDAVIAHLQHAHVVALPSIVTSRGKTEGLPVALTEAMACECAVVASRVAGIPELIDDGRTGVLVAPQSATELADALEALYRDPTRRAALARAGREHVITTYDRAVTIPRLRAALLSHSSDGSTDA